MDPAEAKALRDVMGRQRAIAARLHPLFDGVVDEPLPASFVSLLKAADERWPWEPAAVAAPEGALKVADLEIVGRMAHEMIRAWCELIGDHSLGPWDAAPAWQHDSTLDTVRFFASHPDAGDAAMHEAWFEEKRRAGWVYGPVKDADLKTHPCMVPFVELPPEQQFKDKLFRTVIEFGLANPLRGEGEA